jgi:hypothetical protein
MAIVSGKLSLYYYSVISIYSKDRVSPFGSPTRPGVIIQAFLTVFIKAHTTIETVEKAPNPHRKTSIIIHISPIF